MAINKPALAIGAGAAALALAASSKRKSKKTPPPEGFEAYQGKSITLEPDGSKVYVGVEWPYEVLVPTLNNLEDTPLDSLDAMYGYLKIVSKTNFKTTDGKSVKLSEMPETPQIKELKDTILDAAKAYVAARGEGLSKVLLGHYSKIMAQYKCELPESPDYLPPSCIISIALGNI